MERVYSRVGGASVKLAKYLTEAIGADLHEIQPEAPYAEEALI